MAALLLLLATPGLAVAGTPAGPGLAKAAVFLAIGLLVVLLAVLAGIVFDAADKPPTEGREPSDPAGLDALAVVDRVTPTVPVSTLVAYGGYLGEVRKRFQTAQVGKTLDAQLDVGAKFVRAIDQARQAAEGQLAIDKARIDRERLVLEDVTERLELQIRSLESEVRRVQAEATIARTRHEIRNIENPPPPAPEPRPLSVAQRARREATAKGAKLASTIAVLAEIDRREKRALAKADPEDRALIIEAFRKVKDELREDL